MMSMWRPITVFVAFLALAWPCLADIPLTALMVPAQLCRPAIAAAERAYNIPAHLLAAIAHVESGRKDPASGAFMPWPWTINADGQGSFYETKAQAIAAVVALRKQGARSIDVGCMQISLLHHPDAFANLDQAFDPVTNANYGARFLTELYGKANAWPRAVEMYHSATPQIGQDYGRQVYAALPAEQRLGGSTGGDSLVSAWAATTIHSPFSGAYRSAPFRVIPLSGGAPGVARVAAGGAGLVAQGRSLTSYRMAPVRLASRMP